MEYYPGWAKAIINDVNGIEHILIDKIPVLGLEYNEIAKLPIEKYIRAEIVNDFGNAVEINTEEPDGIETEDGKTHFIVSKENIKGYNEIKLPLKNEITKKLKDVLSGKISREDVTDWAYHFIQNEDKFDVVDIEAYQYLIECLRIDLLISPNEYLYSKEDILDIIKEYE